MGLRNRHWKQRFSEDAEFTWNKSLLWGGEQVQVGDPIPDDLRQNGNRLRRFWESGAIALSGFQAPDVSTGRVPEPEKEGEESPSSSFMNTLAAMGWKQSEAVETDTPSDAQKTGVVDWTKLTYFQKMKVARDLGYDGANMSKIDLEAYLEQHANGKSA